MNSLVFNKTLSLTQYFAQTGATSLDVIKNPHTGKLFFQTDTGDTGKVSTKELGENPVISECHDENGEVFWMLHAKAEGNVVRSFAA